MEISSNLIFKSVGISKHKIIIETIAINEGLIIASLLYQMPELCISIVYISVGYFGDSLKLNNSIHTL